MKDQLQYIKLIPAEPDFVPGNKAQDQCRKWLSAQFPDEELLLQVYPNLIFVDHGDEPEQVRCNKCGEPLDLEYWQDLMEKAHMAQFESLVFETACCHAFTSLNELQYPLPAGFARFMVDWQQPGGTFSAQDLEQLEAILGTPLKKIEGYY
jgi:hypothetical protein